MQGTEHPPIHVHVLHPDGKASIAIDGTVINAGVPADVIAKAVAWIAENTALVEAEWTKMHNPAKR